MSDSPVIAFLNKLTDLMLLNLLWLVCSVPVVTMGASTTAMYYVSITSIRSGDGYVLKRFFKSFKENFMLILPVWLGMLVCAALLAGDVIFWSRIPGSFAKGMLVMSIIVAVLLFMVELWIFPVFAKLKGSRRNLLKNAAAFAIGYLPYTAIVLVMTIAAVYLNLTSLVSNIIMLFIGFALLSYMQSFFFYRVFMNHIDERYDDFDSVLDDEKSDKLGEVDENEKRI